MHIVSIAFLLIAFIPSTLALSIEAPHAIPENVSWGFKVVLDPTESWSKASVMVDNVVVADAFPNGAAALDPNNGQFVLKVFMVDEDKASTAGLSLYVAHIGLPNGEHTVSVSTESGSDSKEVVSFTALDKGFGLATEEKFSKIDERLQGGEDDKALMWRKVIEDSNKVSYLLGKSKLFDSKISSLSEQLSGVNSLASQIFELQQGVIKEAEKKKNEAPVAAFIGFASDMATPLAYLVGIIIAILVFLFVAQFIHGKVAGASIYTKRDEHGLPLEQEPKKEGGKWAAK